MLFFVQYKKDLNQSETSQKKNDDKNAVIS